MAALVVVALNVIVDLVPRTTDKNGNGSPRDRQADSMGQELGKQQSRHGMGTRQSQFRLMTGRIRINGEAKLFLILQKV